MKFKIKAVADEIHLLCCDGTISIISEKDVAELIFNYDMFDAEKNETIDMLKMCQKHKGVQLATLHDDNTLEIHDASFMKKIMYPKEFPYYTPDEFAQKHNRQGRIVRRLCNDGRIEGAIQVGQTWFIPRFAEYPSDQRAGRDMSKRYTRAHKSEL